MPCPLLSGGSKVVPNLSLVPLASGHSSSLLNELGSEHAHFFRLGFDDSAGERINYD